MAEFTLAPDWHDQVQDIVHPKIIEITIEGVAIARHEVPVLTGLLLSTILHNIVDDHGEISADTPYAHFVEFNNKSFLRTALFYLAMKLGGGFA